MRANGLLIVALLTAFVAACYGFGISLFAQLIPDMRVDLGFDYGLSARSLQPSNLHS